MVRLPSAEDVGGPGSLISGRPIATYDTSTVSRGAAALAQGAQALGNAAVSVGMENLRDEKSKAGTLQEAQADAAYRSGKIKLDSARDDESDADTLGGYREKYQGNLEAAGNYITDPEKRKLWLTRRTPDVDTGEQGAKTKAFGIQKDKALAGAYEQLTELQKTGPAAKTEEDRAAAITTGHNLINSLEEAGYVSKEEAAKRREGWASGYAVEAFKRLPAADRLAAIGGVGSEERTKQAFDFFRSQGWSAAQAAGIVGNLHHESGGLNTNAINRGDGSDGSDSIGIAQWNAGRATALKAFATARGKPVSDFETQLAFVDQELRTTHKSSRLDNAKTAREAAAAVVLDFERPKGADTGDAARTHGWGNRSGQAERVLSSYGGGAPAAGATGPGTITPTYSVVGDSHAKAIETAGKIDGDTEDGRNPAKVLEAIRANDWKGENVILSTGAANDPERRLFDKIPEQIAELKKRGAAGVMVLGVGPKFGDADAKLEALAKANGAEFKPLEAGGGSYQDDKVHLTNYSGLFKNITASTATASASPGASTPAGGGNAAPAPARVAGGPPGSALLAYIPPDRLPALKKQAENEIEDKTREQKAAERAEIAKVKSLQKDDEASIAATGKPIGELTPERVAKAMGPDAAAMFEANRGKAIEYHRQTNDMEAIPDSEIAGRLKRLEPKAGEGGYAESSAWYETAKSKASEIRKQRMTDPAAAVDKLPDVAAAKESASLDSPDSYRALVRARLEAQERLQIPQDLRSPITRDEARQLWRPIATAGPDDQLDVLRETAKQVQAAFGDDADEVMQTVLKEGHADKKVRETTARVLRKLATGDMPSRDEARAVDEAHKDAAMSAAVSPVAPTSDLGESDAMGNSMTASSRSGEPRAPTPDADAIAMLRKEPRLKGKFDQVYGAGAADKVLAIAKPVAPAVAAR